MIAQLTTLALLLAPPSHRLPMPMSVDASVERCIPGGSYWEGGLDFRGDRWTLRLHVHDAPQVGGGETLTEAVSSRLDIPDMLMAGRPAALRCDGHDPLLELPFGFGTIRLGYGTDEGIRGVTVVAGDSLRVAFRPAPPPPYTIEEVVFRNGDVTLAGSLYLPRGKPRHPAIVVVHGSGPQGRGMLEYRSWGDFHARRGIAALVYDKRGVGASEGDFRTDSAFTDLTGDALAAVRYLQQRPEIDAGEIGLAGASQAAWISYRAAQDSAVAFLTLLAPPSVSVAEQELQRVRATTRAEGYPPEAVAAAVAHTRLLLAVASTGLGWEGLAASVSRVGDEPWADLVHRPVSLDDLRWWRDHADVDPRSDIDSLRIPLFVAFSAQDPVVPSHDNAGPLRDRAALDLAADITVLTVPRGNHRLEVPAGRDEHGRWRLPRIHPDVLSGLTDWLRWRRSHSDAGRSGDLSRTPRPVGSRGP